MCFVIFCLGRKSAEIAKEYRKRGSLKDAIRCASEDEESNKDFIADCILAEVRASLSTIKLGLDSTREVKLFSYDSLKEVEISELDMPFIMTTSLKGCKKIEDEISQEQFDKADRNQLNIERRKLATIISMHRDIKDSRISAEAHQLLGLINNDPQMVIKGLDIFDSCKCDIGVIKSIQLLMSCKPEPYKLTSAFCEKVADSLEMLCNILNALVQPTKINNHILLKNCLEYYVVDKEISVDMTASYRPLTKEGTRINLSAKKCYSQSKIHEFIAFDLLKIADKWSASVENVINTEFLKFLKCSCNSGRRCSMSLHVSNSIRCHLPAKEIISFITTKFKMAGYIFNIRSKLNQNHKNEPNFLPVLLKKLKSVQETCDVLQWADRLFMMLFPSSCFSYDLNKTRSFELLHSIKYDAFKYGIHYACFELDKNYSKNCGERLTDCLLKKFLLSVIADQRLKSFRELLSKEELAVMRKVNKNKNSERQITFGYSISTNPNTGEVVKAKNYFRFLCDAFSTICTNPFETIKSINGFICYIVRYPDLIPKFSNFALIAEFHMALIAIVLVNHLTDKFALLPSSYIALLNFFHFNANFPKKSTFMQSIAKSTIYPPYILNIQEIAFTFIDILFGMYTKCKNESILTNAMQINDKQFSEDEMERLLILALVLLINCNDDSILQPKKVQLMLSFLKEKVKNALQQTLMQRNESTEAKPTVSSEYKFSDKMINTLTKLCSMKNREEAIKILQDLLTNRNGEYLYICNYSSSKGIVEYSYVCNFCDIQKYWSFHPNSKDQNDNVDDDDVEKKLLAISQAEEMSIDVVLSHDVIILPSDDNSIAETLVPHFGITELKCSVCGEDFIKPIAGIMSRSSESHLTSVLISEEINQYEEHKRSMSHEKRVENYRSFYKYSNNEVTKKLHDIGTYKEELKKLIYQYPTDENLAQTVQKQLLCIEDCTHEILDFIAKSIENCFWHKLEDLTKLIQKLERTRQSFANKVREAIEIATRVIKKIVYFCYIISAQLNCD